MIRNLRASFGNRADQIPVPVLSQVLTVIGVETAEAATADINRPKGPKEDGSYCVLTRTLIVFGSWSGALPRGDLRVGEYEIQAHPRSLVAGLRVKSTSGAPWLISEWEDKLQPWGRQEVQATVTLTSLGDVALPLSRADSDAVARFMEALCDGMRR